MSVPASKLPNNFEKPTKKITLRKQNPDIAKEIAHSYKITEVAAKVLAARGFKLGKELEDFIDPSLQKGLPDPKDLKGIYDAAKLLSSVVDTNKPIAICCDFDVDGLSGGALLSKFLLDANIPNKVFVPDRFNEGYGLNERIIKEVSQADFGLLICIDFGTTNSKELKLAKELGLPTIVIDHHHVDSIPDATVFVNPKQKGCGFCGEILCAAGLVWYFTVALRSVLEKASQLKPRDYLDFACLGTICDMVPLIGANRVIAKRGLEVLTNTRRAGLIALKNVVGVRKEVTCTHVGFGIGPRLNAAGRMINAEMVIDLLVTSDSRKAEKLSKKLDILNKQRQTVENDIKNICVQKVLSLNESPSGIVVYDQNFHTGVIGIVAQRLVENFYRPSAVIGLDQDNYKGSVRGVSGFNVVGALSDLREYLIKFGGHEGAGGFSLKPEMIDKFCIAFNEYCAEKLKSISKNPLVSVDTDVTLKDLTVDLVNDLAKFAPYGMGNPAPVIGVPNVEVGQIQVLKGEHIKANLSNSGITISGFLWKNKEHPALKTGAKVYIAGRPEINLYNGVTSLQMNLQAVE
jgi:single-stranded-DNA-specific exonuclease